MRIYNKEKEHISVRLKATWTALRIAYEQTPPAIVAQARRNVVEGLIIPTSNKNRSRQYRLVQNN